MSNHTIDPRTYLELSQEGCGAHKFYEVVVEGTEVAIRYGRIGETGQSRTASYATRAKAEAAASKKIAEKLRKGYAPAVRGVRKRRPATRRQIVSRRSTARRAPVLWRFRSGSPALGIFVDDERCWVGNQAGDVYTLAHDGSVTARYGLPDGVKCIVSDDFWIYAGCDDGKVYDLGAKIPHVAYEIAEDVDIFWLDIHDGVLGVSDADGRITMIDHEDDFQWARSGSGRSGWMVRCDEDGVYHGHSRGVAMYDSRTGDERWTTPTSGSVLFGWQEGDEVFAGTRAGTVDRIGKDGALRSVYRCDASVFSCAASPDGRYVFAGDSHSSVYCFARDGRRLWKLATGCGAAYSMQFHGDRLYVVTTDGSLACIDASESAVTAAEQGSVPDAVDVKAPAWDAVTPSAELETVTAADIADVDGVVVECVDDDGRLRVRVASPGFDPTWRVQFPKDIRHPGARYVVADIAESSRGGFYRVRGDIRRLA
ncbi:outer membrane protein assembly factor BamB [Nocardiopsis mwathae]|uniref:Outer membrane protein assembly factor BamB n=1 Tax=Nocardiopsis mwathae TaxID=1472723 RepID=A0A7W9YM33_9ACTN|nr:WGR domain-containing protein [Nocardiopsis mwathae]MBB6174670.1 outer membrane protein assembly factor BamB [Nocardiopsis mwathae]